MLERGLRSRKFSHCSIKLRTSAVSPAPSKEGNSKRIGGRAQKEEDPATYGAVVTPANWGAETELIA